MTTEEIRVWATNYVTETQNKQAGAPWYDEDEEKSKAFIAGAIWMQEVINDDEEQKGRKLLPKNQGT